jgi:hypothetical protein
MAMDKNKGKKKPPGSAIGKAAGKIVSPGSFAQANPVPPKQGAPEKYHLLPKPKPGPSYGKRPEVGPSYGQRPSKGTPIKPYVPNWDVPAGTPWKENSPYNPANPKKPNVPKKPGVVPPKKKPPVTTTTTTTGSKTPGVAQALPKKKKK